MKIIFLAGVHGVGKGFLGSQVAQLMNLDHLTASQLIREEKGRATWDTNKQVTDIDGNQLALMRAIENRRKTTRPILLDGHFVLRSVSGELNEIKTKIFTSLSLSGVILLADSPHVIFERLLLRDGHSMSVESISELAVAEKAHAQKVCDDLNIALVTLEAPDLVALKDAISGFIDA